MPLGTPFAPGVSVQNCFFGGPRTLVKLSSLIGVLFEKCRFDRVRVDAPSRAENAFKDSLWSNAGKIINAGPGSTLYLESDITVNGKAMSLLSAGEVEKFISGARGLVHLDGPF